MINRHESFNGFPHPGWKKKSQASKENTRRELGVVPVCWLADKSRPVVDLDIIVLLALFCLEGNLKTIKIFKFIFKKNSETRIAAPTLLLVFCTETYAR